jgi:hypothetical protein
VRNVDSCRLYSRSTIKGKNMNAFKINRKALIIGLALLCLTVPGFSLGRTAAATATPVVIPQNKELDFNLVNQTGYNIKLLYIGPSKSPEWTADMEILKGRVFRTGTQMPIRFNPKTQATKWDIMVEWTDGSKSAQWLGLDLSTVEKLTILYDAHTDKTSFRVN